MNSIMGLKNLGRFMMLGVIVVALMSSFSCKKGDRLIVNNDTDDPPGPQPTENNRLAFRVTCFDPSTGSNRGVLVDVMIFDQKTGLRMELGSTLPDGYFCTLGFLDPSKEYRVEIYDLPGRNCVLAAWGFTFDNQPNMWVKKCGDPAPNSFHLGECGNFFNESGCWGG